VSAIVAIDSMLTYRITPIITPLQHGFMRNRSCVTQLLSVVSVLHSIGESLDRNIQTDILYLDFAKAFDCVDHVILIKKLKWYCVTGHLLDWFTDYLRNRYERVVIDGVASQYLPVTFGVPKGASLVLCYLSFLSMTSLNLFRISQKPLSSQMIPSYTDRFHP
jgi:hypothetical protein